MSVVKCIIGLGATDCTETIRQPEESYQPVLSVQCCRLPLRNLNEQQSIGRLASVHTVILVMACQKEFSDVDRSSNDNHKHLFSFSF